MFHHLRLFGWLPALSVAAVKAPAKTLALVAAYAAVHRQQWWQRGVHRFLGFGASRRSIALNPYKELYSKEQRYLCCIHPHGMLVSATANANSLSG